MKKLLLKIAALIALAGLAACDDMRPVRWVGPKGMSPREGNQIWINCRVASGGPEAIATGNGFLVEAATENFVACMRAAGFTQQLE